MPAGLPAGAWVLLAASVGLGLALVLAYYAAQRGGSADRESE